MEKPKVVLLRSSKTNMQVVSSHDPILTNQKTILLHECNYINIKQELSEVLRQMQNNDNQFNSKKVLISVLTLLMKRLRKIPFEIIAGKGENVDN